MNRTKTIASALLVMMLPFTSPSFASERDREHGDRGRDHEYGEYRQGRHDGHYGHHRHHYRHHYYNHHDRHHYRHHDAYRHSEYRGHDNHASVSLPFPPLPPFPVIIFKPHH